MSPSLIWGTILVLLGLSLILKSLFQITIPLIRPFFGCVLVYLGLSIMMDPFTESPDKKSVMFGTSKVHAQQQVTTYNVTFGSAVIDLSTMDVTDQTEITVNTVLGASTILLNPLVPTKVRVNALVARASLPDETLVSFGRNVYKTAHNESKLTLHVNVVLGNVDLVLPPSYKTGQISSDSNLFLKEKEA